MDPRGRRRVALLVLAWILAVAALWGAPRPPPPILDLLPLEVDAPRPWGRGGGVGDGEAESTATPWVDGTSSATWESPKGSP